MTTKSIFSVSRPMFCMKYEFGNTDTAVFCNTDTEYHTDLKNRYRPSSIKNGRWRVYILRRGVMRPWVSQRRVTTHEIPHNIEVTSVGRWMRTGVTCCPNRHLYTYIMTTHILLIVITPFESAQWTCWQDLGSFATGYSLQRSVRLLLGGTNISTAPLAATTADYRCGRCLVMSRIICLSSVT